MWIGTKQIRTKFFTLVLLNIRKHQRLEKKKIISIHYLTVTVIYKWIHYTAGSENPCSYENPLSSPLTPCDTVIPCTSLVCPCTEPLYTLSSPLRPCIHTLCDTGSPCHPLYTSVIPFIPLCMPLTSSVHLMTLFFFSINFLIQLFKSHLYFEFHVNF